MNSILLGTGASEAIPAAFCKCKVCERARKLGGREIRTRSDFLIDEENLIDYGPDIILQCMRYGIDLSKLKNIFLTHFHEDHLNIPALAEHDSAQPALESKISLYASKAAIDMIKQILPCYCMHLPWFSRDNFENIDFKVLEPYKTYKIDGLEVTPVNSSHYGYGVEELGFNYFITDKKGKTFLYATDTGYYYDETWEYLKSAPAVDYVIIECTYGNQELPDYQDGHLDFKNLKFMLERLEKLKIIDTQTPVYLTHICHINTLTNGEMSDLFKTYRWNVIPGYDGMKTGGEENS